MKKTAKEVEDRITHLRVVERMSLRDIAKIVDCDHTTVDRIVRRYPLTEEERKEIWRKKIKGVRRRPDGRLASGQDVTEQRFGRLTAHERIFSNDRSAIWRCTCDCGNTSNVRIYALLNGTIQSCGCYARDMARARLCKPVDKVEQHRIYLAYKKGAVERDLDFALTKDECVRFFISACEYCGVEAFIGETKKTCRFNGIDRIDSSKGYVIGNCVPCCSDCNYAKSDKTRERFLSWAQRLYNHQFQRGECAAGEDS